MEPERWRRLASILLAASGLAGCAAQETPPVAPRQPPNIVFVLVDDLRWDEVRAAGHPFVDTPHMDRLAREGIRFLNAFTTTPLCSPSRASFLTGQYPHTNGIIDNTARASHELPVFPRELQRVGYLTAFFGKWHMGNDDSPRPGFNHWVAMPGQGEALNPQLNVDGERLRANGYVTDLLTDYVDRFIQRAASARRPFLVYLAHKAVHPNVVQRDDGSVGALEGQPGGFVAAERHRGRYAGRAMPRRPSAFKPPLGKPALLRRIGELPPLGPDTATTDEEIRGRLEMLLAVDDSLGRVLASLEALGQLDNTVVVLTSDNGYFYGEHGLSEERRLAYEEAIRVPLLVRGPPVARPGTTAADLVLNLDLAPTFLELAGLTPAASVQGRSLVPILANRVQDWRSSFLIEYFSDTVFPRVLNMGYVAARTTRHKYIHYQELEGMDEAYDLESDPFEEHNLVGDAGARAVLEQVQSELRRLMAETGYPTATKSGRQVGR